MPEPVSVDCTNATSTPFGPTCAVALMGTGVTGAVVSFFTGVVEMIPLRRVLVRRYAWIDVMSLLGIEAVAEVQLLHEPLA